jgi:cell division protein ZapA (FtsZ GTPase activity inhibitor)
VEETEVGVMIEGRKYPITVPGRDAETVIRAEKALNDCIRDLRATYTVNDKQDLIAMAAMQMAVRVMKSETVATERAEMKAALEDIYRMLGN